MADIEIQINYPGEACYYISDVEQPERIKQIIGYARDFLNRMEDDLLTT